MAHKVHLYSEDDQRLDGYGPATTLEFEKIEDAVRHAIGVALERQDFTAALVSADHDLAADLAEHLRNANAFARAVADHPEISGWISTLTEDLEYWSSMGVQTPLDLEKHLALETYSEVYREVYNVRPRGGPSFEDSLDDILKKTRALAQSKTSFDEGPSP